MHIKISKRHGLDIPIQGMPGSQLVNVSSPQQIGLDLAGFGPVPFKLLCRCGDAIKLGQPLLLDKKYPSRLVVSPAGGILKEIRRGVKRQLSCLVIDKAEHESHFPFCPLDPTKLSRQELKEHMCARGLFAHIHMRPFGVLANPEETPRSIFIKALESAPFVPDAELQVCGHEEDFQWGLLALKRLTDGPVHLVHRQASLCRTFTEAQGVCIHTVEGPHPSSHPSVHIHHIDPITQPDARIWTVNVHDVVIIGKMLRLGLYHHHQVIAIGGPAIAAEHRVLARVRTGHPIHALINGRVVHESARLLSGDPLHGTHVSQEDFLKPHHFAMTALNPHRNRQLLHFLRMGWKKYSQYRAYPSAHLNGRLYEFTTSLAGEERSFIDCEVYDRVMPLHIPTAFLVKAVLAGDYEQAQMLGVLEIVAEDFALPAFVCPSKIEMVDIMSRGLTHFANQLLT